MTLRFRRGNASPAKWPVWIALLGLAALAQTPSAPTHFDAASIQPAAPPGMGMKMMMVGVRFSPGRITAENDDLKSLIETAFNLKPYQVEGPQWMSRVRFNVTAEVQQPLDHDAMAALLKPYLIQQFGLQTHTVSRIVDIYSLETTDKSKLVPATPGDEAAKPAMDGAPDGAIPGRGGAVPDGPNRVAGGNAPVRIMFSPQGMVFNGSGTMSGFAGTLSRLVDRPVIDNTGLTGSYKYNLQYMPGSENPMMRQMRGMKMAAAGAPPPAAGQTNGPTLSAGPDGGPPGGRGGPGMVQADIPPVSIFTALPEQMGLKLVPKKGPITVLVIDHANQKPAGNN